MSIPFVPERWTEQALESLKQGTVYWQREDPNNRRTITERVPRSPEWLQARQEFITQWEQLTTKGVAAGYLENDGCFECGGEIQPTTVDYEIVRRPNPDYIKPDPHQGESFIKVPRT